MWLWGGMLYIWMISLIFYRYTFFPFQPGDLTPPYWINMGAMAISTLFENYRWTALAAGGSVLALCGLMIALSGRSGAQAGKAP